MHNIEDIRYLIKFVSKYEYAKDLISGKLFMRPARYYHNLEKGQGDIMEASVISGLCMYKDFDIPIYCLYADCESENKKIIFSNKLITDFHCENGYAVVIHFSEFSNLLSQCNTNGYSAYGGLVKYMYKPFENIDYFIENKNYSNLFFKDPAFSYQNEFRFIVCKRVSQNQDSVIYTIPSIKNFSKIFSVKNIKIVGENRVIYLNNKNDI